MSYIRMYTCLFLFSFLLLQGVYANNLSNTHVVDDVIIEGRVYDASTREPIKDVYVYIYGTVIYTSTNADGDFSLVVSDASLPVELIFSHVSYNTLREIYDEDSPDEATEYFLTSKIFEGSDVVVSASRITENFLRSPITVQRFNNINIAETPSPNFYDGLENLSGVHAQVGSILIKSINTRGFASLANTRFVQFVDGVDMAPPGLNFSLGNFVSISELDVGNAELIAGPASALYGPNAFNGVLSIQSKDPFLYQGVSVSFQNGLLSSMPADDNLYTDVALRISHGFSDRLAVKFNFSWYNGKDWHANNMTDVDQNPINAAIRGVQSPSYDGLNVYGDEVAVTQDLTGLVALNPQLTALFGGAGYQPGIINVSRTGYQEVDLVDYNAKSIKLSGGIYFRLNDNALLSYNYKYGSGEGVYQGVNRYSLEGISINQHHIAFETSHFKLSAYATLENAGDSYDIRFAAWNLNRLWKSDTQWFTDYFTTYLGTLAGQIGQGQTPDEAVAHAAARSIADVGRYEPNTDEFNTALEKVKATAGFATGSQFSDNSKLYHVDAQYDLGYLLDDGMNLLVGGNIRNYVLDSKGTIFNDKNGPISIVEWGAFGQWSANVLDERLTFTVSGRYDKHKNFEGRFTPRVSLVYSLDEDKTHNFRFAFQTGFRNPDVQLQYLGINLGIAYLLGGTKDNVDNFEGTYTTQVGEVTIDGEYVYNNILSRSSVLSFQSTQDPTQLKRLELDYIKPERVVSWEFGYRGTLGRFAFVDANVYYNYYNDFQVGVDGVLPLYTEPDGMGITALSQSDFRVFRLYTNVVDQVESWGLSTALTINMDYNFQLYANYSYSDFFLNEDSNPDILPGFNTPKHRYTFSLRNRKLFNSNWSMAITYRGWSTYEWDGSFAGTIGTINGEGITDVQLNYKIPSWNGYIKIGTANLFNVNYNQAYGAPTVGSQYYISLVFNSVALNKIF